MPLIADAQRHVDEGRANFRLYERPRGDGGFLNWAIVVLFYAALQLVDAYNAQTGGPLFRDHSERRMYLQLDLAAVWLEYRRLEDESRDCRYRQWHPTNLDVEQSLKRFQRISGHLDTQGVGW